MAYALNGESVAPPRERSNPGQPALAGRSMLIDVDELAKWLGVEVVFVRRLVAERRIPFLKIGKFVRFDPGEVSTVDRPSACESHQSLFSDPKQKSRMTLLTPRPTVLLRRTRDGHRALQPISDIERW